MTMDITVRAIADIIRRPHEEMGTVVDRIRGWADVGLLKVVGDRFPGTGKRRVYEAGAIVDALVLTGLVDAGLAAVRAGHFQGARGLDVLGFGRMGASEILNPSKQDKKMQFLIIQGQPTGQPAVALADENTPLLQRSAKHAQWLIILNLTELFRPLQGIVSVVSDHGFIQVELVQKKGK